MSGLGIALYIAIVCVIIAVITLIAYFLIDSAYKYIKYQDFLKKIEHLIHEQVIARGKSMLWCIGKPHHKRAVLDNMYSEYSYNVYAVQNDNPGEDTVACYIYDMGNVAIVCVIEEDTLNMAQHVHKTLITRLQTRYKNNLFLKSLLLVVDFDDFRSDDAEKYIKIITSICEHLSLNIPLYIAFDCYHSDYNVVELFKCIPCRMYTQMFGYTSPKIWDTTNVSSMMQQMKTIEHSVGICVNDALLKSNNPCSNYALFKAYKQLIAMLDIVARHVDKFMKKFVSAKKPIFRCFSCIYRLEIEGDYKYIFLADLIYIKMSIEHNLIMLSGNIVTQDRSTIKEIFILLFILLVSSLFTKFIIAFSAYGNELYASAYKVQTLDYNNLDRDAVIKSINNVYQMNEVIKNRPKYNPFTYVENIYINIHDVRDYINYWYLYHMYKHLKAKLIDKIKYEVNFENIEFDIKGNIQNILDDINKQYQILQELIDLHNRIVLENHTMVHMVDVMKRLYKIHDNEIKYKPYDAKYYLDNVALININDFNINLLSENIIKYLIAEADKAQIVKQLAEVLPLVQSIVAWQDVDAAVHKINILIRFLDTLRLDDIYDYLTYAQVVRILEKFSAINYVTSVQHEKLMQYINVKIQRNFSYVRGIYNSVLGPIYVIKNKTISLSDEMVHMLDMSYKLLDSVIYKKYTISKESQNHFMLEKDKHYVITNIDFVNSLFLHYYEDPATKGKTIIEIVYKNLLSKIMYKILMIGAYDIFKVVDIDKLGDKHYLLQFTCNVLKNADAMDQMIAYLSQDYDKSKDMMTIMMHVFDQYVNKLYTHIIHANYLKEHTLVTSDNAEDNYIKKIHDISNEELLVEKIDSLITSFTNYLYSVGDAVAIIYRHRYRILSEQCIAKIEYIHETINAIKQYEEDAEKSRIGLLRTYIISLISRTVQCPDVYNQRIVSVRDHVAYMYHAIYNNANAFYNRLRYNHVLSQVFAFKATMEPYKALFPFNIEGQ